MNILSAYPFIKNALFAGVGISIVAGPIGSLLIWRRMSYFGDTLAHSTLLGLAIAIMLNINVYYGLVSICLLIGVTIGYLAKDRKISIDAILSMLSHSALAFGLIAVSMLKTVRVDILSYLYGDILAVNYQDIIWIFVTDLVILGLLIFSWRSLLNITLTEDLARVEKIPVQQTNLCFIIALSLFFAVAIKLVGVLLITALLIIPAVTVRNYSDTPEQMACYASLLGMLSVCFGLGLSFYLDWPCGPAMVAVSAMLFLLSHVCSRGIQRCT